MDATTIVQWATVGLGSVAISLGMVTVGIAIRHHWRDGRIEAARPAIATEIFSRLDEDDPDWDTWTEGLTSPERTVARTLGKQLLRQVHGNEREKLRGLVARVGVSPKRLQRDVESRSTYRTLRALSWLSLLEYPSVVDAALRRCPSHQDVRTATARVLHETGDERAPRTGIRLLVWEGTEPLSVFGLDTLYQIASQEPEYLLSIASDGSDGWNDPVLVQVLTVVRYCQSETDPASLRWVRHCLDHESTAVRAAALATLVEYSWNEQLRNAVSLDDYLTDPEPAVRRVAYQAMRTWDIQDVESFARRVTDEPDDLARLAGVRALRHRTGGHLPISRTSEAFDRTWRWVDAELGVVPAES